MFYIGHSAWLVKTKLAAYIFDYADCVNDAKDGGPENGFINLSSMSDDKIFLLSSHDHHDHYCKRMHKEAQGYYNAVSLLGGVNIYPYETKSFDGISISAAASTDKGVCFLIEQEDGLSIFHGGDNADWGDEGDFDLYYKQIDWVANKNSKIDIAFIPVCTFSGNRLQSLTNGALYAINKLNPAYAFPMHGNGKENLYKEFYKEVAPPVQKSVICAEKIGQKFEL